MGFNSSSLDNIVERVEEVIVTTDDGYERHLTPQEAAQEIAGTAFRKYVEAQKIRTRWSYVRKEN